MPHTTAPVLAAGAPLSEAASALVLVHGRGATAQSILGLGREVAPPSMAILAPQADALGGVPQWYPRSFLAPLAANEPWLSGALGAVLRTAESARAAGIDYERIALGGFSQGACLTLEAAARHARRWGAVLGLSGGLLGTGELAGAAPTLDGMGGPYPDKAFDYDGSLAGTPVFLGCSDVDPHIPLARVERTAEVLAGLGARVEARIYPGMPHTVNHDELDAARELLAGV